MTSQRGRAFQGKRGAGAADSGEDRAFATGLVDKPAAASKRPSSAAAAAVAEGVRWNYDAMMATERVDVSRAGSVAADAQGISRRFEASARPGAPP